MIYGDEKVKEMARSILPSRSAKYAREAKAHVHRTNRRKAKTKVSRYRGPEEDVIDNFEDDGVDLIHDETTFRIMRNRQGADHLNHFMIWAYQRTKHIRPDDRYTKIRKLLPAGLIGEHAASHLDFLKVEDNKYNPEDALTVDMMPYRLRRTQRHYTHRWADKREEILEAIKSVAYDQDQRAKFNRYMKAHGTRQSRQVRNPKYDPNALSKLTVYDDNGYFVRFVNNPAYGAFITEYFDACRLLKGPWDVNAFMADLYSWRAFGYNWFKVVAEYFDIDLSWYH